MKNARRYLYLNLIFIFIFLNVWDYAINRDFFNGMIMGVLMFGAVSFLWFLGKFRAVVLITLLSIFEFVIMSIFVWEGFELNGARFSSQSIFWMPYLVAAAVNGFWGLAIYSRKKEGAR